MNANSPHQRLWRTRLVLIGAYMMFAVSSALGEEFYHDFRTGPLPKGLEYFQAKTQGIVKLEPEGLRITIPKDWQHPFGGVGVKTAFPLRGDFEITTTYEILKADTPPPGTYGVGVTLRINKAESPELANVSRVVRAGGKQMVLWSWRVDPPGEKPKFPEGNVPSTDKVGRLRLKRVGAMLHSSWAPGTTGDNFQEFHSAEFGDGEIKHAVLVGFNGRAECDADVRFLDLRIQSGDVQAAVAAAPPPVPTPAPERSLFWLMILGGVLAVVSVSAILGYWLKQKRAGQTPIPASEPAKAASNATTEVQCPHCQKRLNIRAELIGKKVKCPKCASSFIAAPSREG